MKLATPYKCDYCPNMKGDSNHWWLFATEFGYLLSSGGVSTLKGAFFGAWDDAKAQLQGVEHICSEACAVKALSKWMGEHKV